jgi:hypothetical protein
MVILFSRDSCDFLFISEFIFLILSSNCILLAFMYFCHVGLLVEVKSWIFNFLFHRNGEVVDTNLRTDSSSCSKCYV